MYILVKKTTIVLFASIIFIVVLPLNAQLENWVWSLNGPGNNHDHANAITFGNDGNLYAAGYCRNADDGLSIL